MDVRITKSQDDYRGDLSCVKILNRENFDIIQDESVDYPETELFFFGKVFVGTLKTWKGNMGSSWKDAASSFQAERGITLTWKE